MISNRLRMYPVGKRELLKILDREEIHYDLTFQGVSSYGMQKRLVRDTDARENELSDHCNPSHPEKKKL